MTMTSSPERGRRGAYGAYTQMDGPREATVEDGATEVSEENIPGDRKVSRLSLSEVEGEARSRISSDGENVEAAPNDEVLGRSLNHGCLGIDRGRVDLQWRRGRSGKTGSLMRCSEDGAYGAGGGGSGQWGLWWREIIQTYLGRGCVDRGRGYCSSNDNGDEELS
jgi:hypothetical protein